MILREAALLVLLAALLPALLFEAAWRDLPDAPQTVYRGGVPHTTRTGAILSSFEPERSFFPIGIYHALDGRFHGRDYDFVTLASAGFNTVHAWERQPAEAAAAAAERAGLQLIYHEPDPEAVGHLRDHPAILSWYLDEEPAARFPAGEQASLREAFDDRRATLRALDPLRPYHIVAAPPGRFVDWDAWIRHSDIAAFSVYPLRSGQTPRLVGDRALADSVGRAAALDGEQKPLWFVAQAFASPRYRWRMPTPREYRTMVYAAIVHGATGIIAFAYDSFVTRDGQVLGIAPDPLPDYGAVPDYDNRGDAPLTVSESALAGSRALWDGVVSVNRELAVLAPALLSPTVARHYSVSVRGLSAVQTPVRTILKRDGDGYVLIAVNVGDTDLDVRFGFDAETRDLHRPFAAEAEQIQVTDNGWQIRLAGFETRVFQFALDPAAADAKSDRP